VRLSPETCRVKPLRRIKTQLLHLVGLISLLEYMLVVVNGKVNVKIKGEIHPRTGHKEREGE